MRVTPDGHRAFLVVWLDLSGPLPRVLEAGVYSESAPSTSSFVKRYPVEMASARGSTFVNATENLRRNLSATPHMRWALAWFPRAT